MTVPIHFCSKMFVVSSRCILWCAEPCSIVHWLPHHDLTNSNGSMMLWCFNEFQKCLLMAAKHTPLTVQWLMKKVSLFKLLANHPAPSLAHCNVSAFVSQMIMGLRHHHQMVCLPIMALQLLLPMQIDWRNQKMLCNSGFVHIIACWNFMQLSGHHLLHHHQMQWAAKWWMSLHQKLKHNACLLHVKPVANVAGLTDAECSSK